MSKQSEKNKQVAEPSLKITSKRPQIQKEKETSFSKKRKIDGDLGRSSTLKLSEVHIPEDILNLSCTDLQFTDVLISQRMEIDLKINNVLKDWNKEFVKIKYLQGEYQRRYEAMVEENESLDRIRFELIESRAEVTDVTRSLRSAEAKILALEIENKRIQTELSGNTKDEAALKIIDDFKESYDFKIIIQDSVEKERNHIFDVEVKSLERQCIEDGFIRGFLKGTRLVHRRTGADIEGLTWSQVSEDPSPDLEDDAESVMPSDGSSDD